MNSLKLLLTLVLLAGFTGVQAQSAAEAPAPDGALPTLPGDQYLEYLHTEDAGSTIDEQRYGGQTTRIDVQPRGTTPRYQVQPAGAAGTRSREAGPGSAGPRTWKVLEF